MEPPDLIFNILEQRLNGSIDGTVISAVAVAGGRAGSKSAGAVNPILENNPYMTGVKLSKSSPGGPLPIGRYILKSHEKKQDRVRLLPDVGQSLGNRSDFLIHGRGPRGSDGCIVPMDFHNVLLICKLVKAREDAGKSAPTLEVVAIGDADEPLRRMRQWQRIA